MKNPQNLDIKKFIKILDRSDFKPSNTYIHTWGHTKHRFWSIGVIWGQARLLEVILSLSGQISRGAISRQLRSFSEKNLLHKSSFLYWVIYTFVVKSWNQHFGIISMLWGQFRSVRIFWTLEFNIKNGAKECYLSWCNFVAAVFSAPIIFYYEI